MEREGLMITGGECHKGFASSFFKMNYENRRPDLLIAADKGIETAVTFWKDYDCSLAFAVGDMDSVDQEVYETLKSRGTLVPSAAPETMAEEAVKIYREMQSSGGEKGLPILLTYPREKDATDTELAIALAKAAGVTKLTVLGALGGRADHMAANLGLLLYGKKHDMEITFVDEKNRIRLVSDSLTVSKKEQYGTTVSVLAYTDRVTGLTLEGMQYPLKDAVMERGSSLGISNVITEEEARIRVESGMVYVMECRD